MLTKNVTCGNLLRGGHVTHSCNCCEKLELLINICRFELLCQWFSRVSVGTRKQTSSLSTLSGQKQIAARFRRRGIVVELAQTAFDAAPYLKDRALDLWSQNDGEGGFFSVLIILYSTVYTFVI